MNDELVEVRRLLPGRLSPTVTAAASNPTSADIRLVQWLVSAHDHEHGHQTTLFVLRYTAMQVEILVARSWMKPEGRAGKHLLTITLDDTDRSRVTQLRAPLYGHNSQIQACLNNGKALVE